MFRKIYALIIPLTAALITSCSGGDAKESAEQVHNVFLTNPEQIGSAASRSYAGVVEEARTVATGFKTAGQIKRILVKEGDYVKQGQLLAVLDTVDYALGVSQLRVQHAQQASEMERKGKLHAAGSMSDNDYEKARSGFEQLGLQLALNENKLSYCYLHAPTSGYITKRNFEPAEMVDAGRPVFELMDNSHLEVIVDLPVAEYIRRGDFIGFNGHLTSMPGSSIPLSMMSLTPRADNSQLYRLRLTVADGHTHNLTPGMNITVDIATAASADQMLRIPASSVFQRGDQSCVWVYNPADSTITAAPVTTSRADDDAFTYVTSGIPATSSIVRAGVHHLREGEKVNVITDSSDTNIGNQL